MCVLGAISSTRENGNLPKISIANGAQNFLHIVERMIAVAGMTGLTKDQLPNLRQVIARYRLRWQMSFYNSKILIEQLNISHIFGIIVVCDSLDLYC